MEHIPTNMWAESGQTHGPPCGKNYKTGFIVHVTKGNIYDHFNIPYMADIIVLANTYKMLCHSHKYFKFGIYICSNLKHI